MSSTSDYETEYQFQLTTGFCHGPTPPQVHNNQKNNTYKKKNRGITTGFKSKENFPRISQQLFHFVLTRISILNKSLAREIDYYGLAYPN